MPVTPVISNNTPLVALWSLNKLSLGILLLGKEMGLLPSVKPLIQQLLKSGLYLKPKLVDQVLNLAGEE